MKKTLACIAALLLSTHCLAGDKEGTTVWGIGGMSCGKYLAAWDKGNNELKGAVLTWAQGYLTALNVELTLYKRKPLTYVEPEQIDAYLQKFCRDNPLGDVYLGVARLGNERNPKQPA